MDTVATEAFRSSNIIAPYSHVSEPPSDALFACQRCFGNDPRCIPTLRRVTPHVTPSYHPSHKKSSGNWSRKEEAPRSKVDILVNNNRAHRTDGSLIVGCPVVRSAHVLRRRINSALQETFTAVSDAKESNVLQYPSLPWISSKWKQISQKWKSCGFICATRAFIKY